MGLDMYLDRAHKSVISFIDKDLDELANGNPVIYDSLSPYIIKSDGWSSFFDEVGYWRKANAIHKWFVENVQGGTDDCGRYEVSINKLRELHKVVQEVIDNSTLVGGTINTGTKYTPVGAVTLTEDGKVVADSSAAERLLPTADGFFFGSTCYNEYYIESLEYTLEIIDSILCDAGFEDYVLFYRSSW